MIAYKAYTEGFETEIYTDVTLLQAALISLRDRFNLHGKEVRIYTGKLFGEAFEVRDVNKFKVINFSVL